MVDHAKNYMQMNDRRKQMAYQMSSCIISSLTAEAQLSIRTLQDAYTVEDILHGPLVLLVIIQRATVNVRASAFLYRQRLVRAPEVIREMDYNIKEFNKYVSDVLFNLRARGETAPDTLVHLFNAYKNAPDEDFVNYIKSKETLYEENEIDLDANSLMQFALTKYNTYVEQGTWNQLSRADEQIIALKMELQKLTNKTLPAKKVQSGKKHVSKSKGSRDKKWA